MAITLGRATSVTVQSQAHDLAEMLVAAAPESFATLPSDLLEKAYSCIVDNLLKPGTEFENIFCIFEGKDVVGVIAHYPSAEIKFRKQKLLRELTRIVPANLRGTFLATASEQSVNLPKVEMISTYLARVAVSRDRRGRGIGRRLIEGFLQQFDPGNRLTLHVNSQNVAAIQLYRQCGFVMTKQPGVSYDLMVKEIQ